MLIQINRDHIETKIFIPQTTQKKLLKTEKAINSDGQLRGTKGICRQIMENQR